MRNIILSTTRENDLIVDPFCGSGTTLLAAKMLNRRYIGIDVSETYCGIARSKLDVYERQLLLLK